MTKRLRWYKRDVDAWRGGTRGMSLELRGFYSELLDAMWDRQGPLENDVAKLAITLCCNPRTVRKLLPQLIALGKVSETPDGIINERMRSEMTAPIQADAERNSKPIAREFAPKVAKKRVISTRELEVRNKKKEEEYSPLPPAGGMTGDDFNRFRKRVEQTAGEALDDPARSPSLINPSAILGWLEAGAHPDLDILPAVQSIAAKAKPRAIRSWEYFTRQVAKNKTHRGQGLPVVMLPADSASERQLREIAMI